MEFKFHHILAFICVALVASHAAGLASDEYWKSVLPNTPMPKTIKDLLQPTAEWLEEKGTSVSVGKGGVQVRTGGHGPRTNVGVGKGGVGVYTGKPGHRTNVGVGKGGVGVNTGKPGRRTNVGVGKGGVTVGTRTKSGKPVYVGVKPGSNPFVYNYAATETQLHDNPNVALFFLEKDLHPSTKMNLQFTKSTNNVPFLSREIADSIPFSSSKLPDILEKFSIDPKSNEAEVVTKTINECEETGIKGEEKLCATSLESMVDFSTSKLGKGVEVISTDAENEKTMEYDIVGVKRKASEKPIVVCHKQQYAYAVFYCHKTESTVAYEVSMLASDGTTKADAVAVCHRDTATWNPKHLAFQVLKVKPGSVPICHFLPEDHIVWVPKY